MIDEEEIGDDGLCENEGCYSDGDSKEYEENEWEMVIEDEKTRMLRKLMKRKESKCY